MRAHVVVDLGFGDSGKGLLTDYLVRQTGAALVVRYNGGAQAGHNVVTPGGRHHTFAQLGAGAFAGARTWLSRHVVVHPTALLVEARALEAKGVRDPLGGLAISDRARLVTPYHQAANRLRELARGDARHGSCGVGVGEVVDDALRSPGDVVSARDLGDRWGLKRKLDRARERLRADLGAEVFDAAAPQAAQERAIFERDGVAEVWIDAARRLAGHVAEDAELGARLRASEAVVFEGAQGVLLDEVLGFHPHTTWSRCTAANARELLAEHAPEAEVEETGVLRCYAVRHGAGPLPTETPALAALIREHNAANDWQGPVRYGWFDAVLARYALAAAGVGHLLVTHLDVAARAELAVCPRYEEALDLAVPLATDLEAQARRTAALQRARPVVEPVAGEAGLLARIEAQLERRVDLVARGPQASDVARR